MRLFVFALALAGGLWHGLAWSHDIYMNLRTNEAEGTGMLCCGGDEKTGDCEPVAYEMLPNGDAIFTSKRYGGVPVRIGKSKIQWLMIKGGSHSEAHWCGVPRSKVYLAPVNEENPDPAHWTYCAFIAPGGV